MLDVEHLHSSAYRAAIHEAGHAVAAVRLHRGIVSVAVEADDAGQHGGRCEYTDMRAVTIYLAANQHAQLGGRAGVGAPGEIRRAEGIWLKVCRHGLEIALAGPAAEMRLPRLDDSHWYPAPFKHDRDNAASYAIALCGEQARANELMHRAEARARQFVRRNDNWRAIQAVAARLEQDGTLSGRRVRAIVNLALRS